MTDAFGYKEAKQPKEHAKYEKHRVQVMEYGMTSFLDDCVRVFYDLTSTKQEALRKAYTPFLEEAGHDYGLGTVRSVPTETSTLIEENGNTMAPRAPTLCKPESSMAIDFEAPEQTSIRTLIRGGAAAGGPAP